MTDAIGIDIGGANLKYAHSSGESLAIEFPLWQRPDRLADQLRSDLKQLPIASSYGVTMTGELADCFLDRPEGVRRIAAQAIVAIEQHAGQTPRFYGLDGKFHDPDFVGEHPDLIAAGNWHALASFACREFQDQLAAYGLLIDIGSTTTDVIPISRDGVMTESRTDFDRLAEGSLIYLGAGRTPVCALVDDLPYAGRHVPIMREVFATIDDARLLLKIASVDAQDCGSADGKPRDRFHARNRIARMIGLDHRAVDESAAREMAAAIHQSCRLVLQQSLEKLLHRYSLRDDFTLIISGHGKDLIPGTFLSGRETISLSQELGDALSRSGPAYAIAKLLESEKR